MLHVAAPTPKACLPLNTLCTHQQFPSRMQWSLCSQAAAQPSQPSSIHQTIRQPPMHLPTLITHSTAAQARAMNSDTADDTHNRPREMLPAKQIRSACALRSGTLTASPAPQAQHFKHRAGLAAGRGAVNCRFTCSTQTTAQPPTNRAERLHHAAQHTTKGSAC
jgi:hypothetical protein